MEHRLPFPRQAPPVSQRDVPPFAEARARQSPSHDGRAVESAAAVFPPGLPKLRAAFLTPTLLLGGAERWLISLARGSRDWIEWTGTALTERARANPDLLGEMAAYMPVYAGSWAASAEDSPTVVRCRNGRGALEAAACDADVLIVWGMGNPARYVTGLTIPIVFVSHGGSPRVIRSSKAGATHFVAVSEAARMRFSPPVRPAVTILHNGIGVERAHPPSRASGCGRRGDSARTSV